MSTKKIARAAKRLARRAGGPLEIAIVLGSGLATGIRERIEGTAIPFDKLDAPRATIAGHPGVAYVGTWAGKRVAAFAGRPHLYEGHAARDVTYVVRLAATAGARTIVLTNAAGALNAAFARGDVMLIADHINLTGASPLGGNGDVDPFVNMIDAYAPHLRVLARERAEGTTLHEGVYAGVRGPSYETAAECESLRRMGADAVGMSTVLETIAARAHGMDVLGLSLITNIAGPPKDVSHAEVLAASKDDGEKIVHLVERVIAAV